MAWSLILLAISVGLIHDIQTAPNLNLLGNKAELETMNGSYSVQYTPCVQCQGLALDIINYAGEGMLKNDTDSEHTIKYLKSYCREDRTLEYFCSQIQGKEAKFVAAVQDGLTNGKGKELCSNFSGCDPSPNMNGIQIIWNGFWKPMSTCGQCQSAVFGLTNKLPDRLLHERQYYYRKAADSLMEGCRVTDVEENFSGLCSLIEGRELEFAEMVLDCAGVKFKDDKNQPICRVKATNDGRGMVVELCSYVAGNWLSSCHKIESPEAKFELIPELWFR